MTDIININAEATRQGFQELEARVRRLETTVMTLEKQNQTLINLVGELQRNNNLALAQLRGTGATS